MSPEDIKAAVSAEAQERIDGHVENDTQRWKMLAYAIVVMGVILAVLSVAFLAILSKANHNAATANRAASHATAAICVEVAYLDAVSVQSKGLIKADPDPIRTPVRVQQLAFTKELTGFLKAEIPNCPIYKFKTKLEVPTPAPKPTPTPTTTPTP